MCDVACGTELRIQSNVIYLRPVRAFVRELAETVGFCREKADNIELAVDEVFANALEHGSTDTESPVIIQCLSTDDMMKIIISDTGSEEVSDTSWIDAWTDVVKEQTKSQTERGHGLLLAYNLTDEMSVKPNSTGGIDVHLVMYKEDCK